MTLENQFPKFATKMKKLQIENKLEPLNDEEIINLETKLNVKLPPSYKRFLKCTGGFWAYNDLVQMSSQHPFYHKFQSFEDLTEQQKEIVKIKGGKWPPPSNGMLCFAEFFMESDGDQVLFNPNEEDENGEFAVYYYSHDSKPPSVRKIANSFEQWLNEFPDYSEFNEE